MSPLRSRLNPVSIAVALFLVGVVAAGAVMAGLEGQVYAVDHARLLASRDAETEKWARDARVPSPLPVGAVQGMPRRQGTALTFGEGPKKTLVVYSTGGRYRTEAEVHALGAAQLVTHFGRVTAKPLKDYVAGEIRDYDAVLYVATTYQPDVPAAFVADVVTGSVPVIWAGTNIEMLTGRTEAKGDSAAGTKAFVDRYGWDPLGMPVDTVDGFHSVLYKDRALPRDSHAPAGLRLPRIVDTTKVTVLADALCGASKPAECTAPALKGRRSSPWALRSANLTYVVESPFAYLKDGGGPYLAYTDLLYAALGREREAVRQAAVRLEDVSPATDPDTIRRYADYLSGAGVPFQIGVIPDFVDREGKTDGGHPRNLTLSDVPQLVAALKYAQSRGGTLVQHGTTHQTGSLANPYSGVTADDFEFFRAACSDTPDEPYHLVPCAENTSVALLGPLDQESEDEFAKRIDGGRRLFEAAGLTAPAVFETPHYLASPAAYRAMRRVYATRYERGLYTDGLLTGAPTTGYLFTQYFPFPVTDVYGSRVLPENVGSVAPRTFSGHAKRSPADIVEAAKANLVVRESTASFFFHPFLPLEQLREIVEGVKAAGYTFVAADRLR